MSGKIGEKLECLRYRKTKSISVPADIELKGDMLTWRCHSIFDAIGDSMENSELHTAYRSIEGCLEHFLFLSESSVDNYHRNVLDFTKRHGVLGLNPLIQLKETGIPNADKSALTFHYQECVLDYISLSYRFACTIRVMQALKEGKPINQSDLSGCLQVHEGDVLASELTNDDSRKRIHLSLYINITNLWTYTNVGIGISRENFDYSHLRIEPSLGFELSFGRWRDGKDWDYIRASRWRDGDMILHNEQEHYERSYARRVREGKTSQAEADKEFLDLSIVNGWEKTVDGEWVTSFKNYAAQEIYMLPNKDMRPSPLFNLLAFDLLKVVTLPEGSYFCGHCDRLYQHNPVMGNKPRKGGESGAFCSSACRLAYKQAYDRQRYLKRISRAKE